MTTAKIIFGLGIIITLFGCGRANDERMESKAMADSTSNAFISSAAVENGKDHDKTIY